MRVNQKIIFSSIVAIGLGAMLFSCTNNPQKVRDFLADKNLPIGAANNVNYIHKDSGRINFKLVTPLLYDYSNRKKQPYNEFPKGVNITTFKNKEKDSVTITGDYALSYTKTLVSEIRGNVLIINHKEKSILKTNQLFWDQKTGYFFSEKNFTLITPKDTIHGIGFESKEDLSKWVAKNIEGSISIKDTINVVKDTTSSHILRKQHKIK